MNTVFLTSMPLENKKEVTFPKLNNTNNFVTQLKKYHIRGFNNFVFLTSDPKMHEENNFYANLYFKAFANSNFKFENYILVDDSNCINIREIIKGADIVILGGGKLSVQNTFFKNINLKQVLRDYDGTIVGMSAGSMNLADTVFDFPELDEQIGNPHFLKGLGYTDINIIPHYNPIKNIYILESRLDAWKTYVLPYSYKIKLYVLVDGAHILIQNNHSEIYGEAYIIKDSIISKVCSKNERCIIEKCSC